jgi:hypothetical protein
LAAADFLVGCGAGLYDMKSIVGAPEKKDAVLI